MAANHWQMAIDVHQANFPNIPRDIAKKDQVKLAGNAVTPPVMQWIVGRIIQALETH